MFSSPVEVIERWVEAINQKDVDGVLELYSEDSVLIPTFSNQVLSSRKAIDDYFNKLTSKDNLSISLHNKTVFVQQDLLSVVSGGYLWTFEVQGQLLNFEARFTFILNPTRKHPIIHHHSSQIPRHI